MKLYTVSNNVSAYHNKVTFHLYPCCYNFDAVCHMMVHKKMSTILKGRMLQIVGHSNKKVTSVIMTCISEKNNQSSEGY